MTHACITVRYSCPNCGIKGRDVQMAARGDEDVITWMEHTCIPTVSRDHAATSPLCTATSLSDLMIPITGAEKVGGVIRQ